MLELANAGALRLVGYFFDPAVPRLVPAIRLAFADGDWTVLADRTVALALQPTADEAFDRWSVVDASGRFPWAAAMGKHVAWAWTLANQRGQLDGLQLEFVDPVRGGDIAIQVLGVASALQVRAVMGVETPHLRAAAG